MKLPASLRVIGRSVVDWWDSWLDMVLVTGVWFLAQLTIILGPPATFGLYYVVYRMKKDGESLGVRGLIEGARKYFGKALLWGLLNLVVYATMAVNFNFYSSVSAWWGFYLLIIVIMIAVYWTCSQFYGLPYFMEQEDKRIRRALWNGFLTSLAAPLFTLVVMLVVLLDLAISIGFIIPFFLALPALIPFLGINSLYDRLESFGLREREKTPREIEAEQGGRMDIPSLEGVTGDGSVTDRAGNAAAEDITQAKGQVEDQERDKS